MKRSIALILLATASWSLPEWPELPLGTASSAHAGGGAAEASGVNAVFTNPAALEISGARQVEVGLMGLAQGISPYALYGSRGGGNSAYALGYFRDARAGFARQGLIAGFSRPAWPGASLGAAVRSQGEGDFDGAGFGVDADAGLLLVPRHWLRLGFSLRNLLESGVGQDSSGFETLRGYDGSVALHGHALSLGFVHLPDPELGYSVTVHGTPPRHVSQVVSGGLGLSPNGTLAAKASLRLTPEGATPAIGIFMDMTVGRHGLVCGYTLDAGEPAEHGTAQSHSLSVNFHWSGRGDRMPPTLLLRTDKVRLSRGGEDRMHFLLSAEDAGRVQSWNLEIRRWEADGNPRQSVRSFQGKELPPRTIRWEGKDEGGKDLPSGYYAFRLGAKDMAGNRGATAWQLLEISAPTAANAGSSPDSILSDTVAGPDFSP